MEEKNSPQNQSLEIVGGSNTEWERFGQDWTEIWRGSGVVLHFPILEKAREF